MNTKFDYEYIRDNSLDGWREQWKNLLEGRFVQEGPRLVEDQNAKIFQLGFTVEEVAAAINFTGKTDREIQFELDHPEWQVDDVDVVYATTIKAAEVEEAKTKIDQDVRAKQAEPFEHAGHKWYPDLLIKEVADDLPEGQIIDWKTADKVDGKSVYVPADTKFLKSLNVARLTNNLTIWAEGDAKKKLK